MLLLLWTVILLSRAQAQSGEPDVDLAPTVSCTSHISQYEASKISCQLISSGYNLDDDEDEDTDAIEKLTACCCKLLEEQCVKVSGDTLSSKSLNPISPISLTVLTKRGRYIEKSLDLRKIIKPKSPQVYNVTVTKDWALVHIQIPYHMDYLKEKDLHLQLHLSSEKTNQTQNMTSSSMKIGGNHLISGTQYHVKVRAIPRGYFQGTWSEWSQLYTFHTPSSAETSENLSFLWLSIIPVVFFALSVMILLLWRIKILTYIWPSIPHPKTTLEKIYGVNNDLLFFYIPEECSSLNVYSSVSQSARLSCGEKDPAMSSAGTNETPPCSTQSTYTSMSTSSIETEELDLLSQSSTSEEGQDETEGLSIHSICPHLEAPEGHCTEHNNTQNKRENSYVTMSSFHHIRTARTEGDASPMKLTVS